VVGIAGTHTHAGGAAALRAALVAELLAEGMITTAAVESALRGVARERFVPVGTELAEVYGYDSSVVTKRDEYGRPLSSVSAAYIQARMLEQAELRPGASVLEVGSGGLNAAYVAEVVGPEGRVVSVDIDPDVTGRAVRLLEEAGYGGRVRVLTADAGRGLPDEGPFDAIIVTVGAWDIAPAWVEQLRPDGVLVLPLVMNGVTRTIGFRRDGDHLVSTSAAVAGFVPLQGEGRREEQVFLLPAAVGATVRLSFDSGAPGDLRQLDGALAIGPTDAWSGATVEHGVSFADLYLWLAWYLDGFCRVSADERSTLAGEEGVRWFPFGVVRGRGFAVLVIRPALDGAGAEFGARAYGSDGHLAATAMVEQIQAWDRCGRQAEPTFAYWPAGNDHTQIPAGVAVMDKTHGVVTISWPTGN
jgi:protein-L-isoaspartate(D-aspartate) O-methyltransferase